MYIHLEGIAQQRGFSVLKIEEHTPTPSQNLLALYKGQ